MYYCKCCDKIVQQGAYQPIVVDEDKKEGEKTVPKHPPKGR